MNRIYRLAAVGILALGAGLASGCAAPHGATTRAPEVVPAGQSFLYGDHAYRVDVVQDDFVLMRYVPDTASPGEVTGWVKEVLRIPRYQLGEGRWALPEEIADGYLQWYGDDRFSITRDGSADRPLANAD